MSRFFEMPELTSKVLHDFFDYNSETGIVTRKISTNNRTKVGQIVGCLRPDGYLCATIGGKPYQLHRLIWLYAHGSWPSGEIDHINGNRSDNRIENLRDVTSSQNGRNKRVSSANTSGVTGVTWFKSRNKWVAAMNMNGKRIHLGYFETIDDAAKARKSADTIHGFHENHGRDGVIGGAGS